MRSTMHPSHPVHFVPPRMRHLAWGLALMLAACKDVPTPVPTVPIVDADSDGSPADEDCDDQDPARSPDFDETAYNGVDDDCDLTTPDDDLDGDGAPRATDCDDEDPLRNPQFTETPYNGRDDDCDPTTPDDDLDADGFPRATDCDDAAVSVNPDAAESPYNGVDDDCDPLTPDDDLDDDGFLLADDCDEQDPTVPTASEVVYNGVDDDCDPLTPDDDLDGDGFLRADDCNDGNAASTPLSIAFFVGDVALENGQDWCDLGFGGIDGTLDIGTFANLVLPLPCLCEVTGNVDVFFSSLDEGPDFSRLERVGADVRVQANADLLTPPSFPRLAEVGGDILISSSDALLALPVFPALELHPGEILVDAALPVDGFPALAQVGALRLYRVTEVDFPALDTVAGELAIEGTGLVSLAGLSALTEIVGDLRVGGNTGLIGADLPVQHVGGDVLLGGSGFGDPDPNPALTAFGLAELQTVGGGIYVTFNEALLDVVGSPALTEVGGDLSFAVVGQGAPGPMVVSGFDGLSVLGGTLYVSANYTGMRVEGFAALEHAPGVSLGGAGMGEILGLQALQSAGSVFGPVDGANFGLTALQHVDTNLTWWGGGQLDDMSGFAALQTVGGELRLREFAVDAIELPSLQSVGSLQVESCATCTSLADVGTSADGVVLFDNPLLTDLSGLSGFTGLGALALSENGLTDLSDLGALEVVTGDVSISEPNLAGLQGLASLTEVGGRLRISDYFVFGDNPFVDLQGLEALEHVGSLRVEYMTGLSSLDGLTGLRTVDGDLEVVFNDAALVDVSALEGVTSVGGALRISSNAGLAPAAAQAVVDAIGPANIGGVVVTGGNGG